MLILEMLLFLLCYNYIFISVVITYKATFLPLFKTVGKRNYLFSYNKRVLLLQHLDNLSAIL
jgi:hypothetical protein